MPKKVRDAMLAALLCLVLLCPAARSLGDGPPAVEPGRAGKGSAGPAGTMSIGRVMDYVVIRGESFDHALNAEIDGLRLLAFKRGEHVVVPFQIDRRDDDGAIILDRAARPGDGGREPGPISEVFDSNDELVFMAMDAGDRVEPGDMPGLVGFDEIELRDPADGGRGWAYLVAFDKTAPPISPIRYMEYIEGDGRDTVKTPYMTISFEKNDVFPRRIAISEKAGGNGEDLMDRIKMRTGVDVLGGAMSVLRSEEDFEHRIVGVRAGPVRIIRRTESRLRILLSLKAPAAEVDGVFTPCGFQFPSTLSMPFRMDLVASDAYIRQGWDMSPAGEGIRLYTSLMDEPAVYDGEMSESERRLASMDKDLEWALGTGPQGTFIFRGEWDPKAPFRAPFYFEDDATRREPPEDFPGVMAFAYRLENLTAMGDEEYYFNIHNWVVPGYAGDIGRALLVFTAPLEARVNR